MSSEEGNDLMDKIAMREGDELESDSNSKIENLNLDPTPKNSNFFNSEIFSNFSTSFMDGIPNYLSNREKYREVLILQFLIILLNLISNNTDFIGLSESQATILEIISLLYSLFFIYYLFTFNMSVMIFGPILFWFYSNKFLSDSTGYISDMSRDLTFNGVQQNISFYPLEDLIIAVGGAILVFYLLIQNEFNNLFQKPKKVILEELFSGTPLDSLDNRISLFFDELFYYLQVMPLWLISGLVYGIIIIGGINPLDITSLSLIIILPPAAKGTLLGLFFGLFTGFLLRGLYSSLFAMGMFSIIYLIVPTMDLSSTTQIPLLFIGGSVLTSFLLVQNNVGQFFELRPKSIIMDLKQRPDILVSLLSIITFIFLLFNASLFPIISDNLIPILSLILLLSVSFWGFILSKELSKPSVQDHRTASVIFMASLPFILYFLLRFMYLLHHPDTVMRNRWELVYDFMDEGNTFRVNTWPFEVEPGADSRWLFYKAAIINSARVTLVSILCCTILGTLVGVTRLSNNKLASNLATTYVEIFRNLPLAVLLFLIATQLGHQLPSGMKNIQNIGGGLFYYNNQGIWFVTVSDYSRLFMGLILMIFVWIYLRFESRVEPRLVDEIYDFDIINRPFRRLGWKLESLVADILIILSLINMAISLQPFLTSGGGGLMVVFSSLILLYSFNIFTKVSDFGLNVFLIDDTPKGVRRRLTIWTLSFAIAIGISISEGFSLPELLQPSASPGSWTFREDFGFEITPPFLAMVLGLTLFTASVIAEIVRGSIQSLPRGQVEAAISLGLSPFQRLRLVILPQALRSMIPLFNNQFMNVWKNSSLAIVVAYNDIFYQFLVMSNNVGKIIPLFVLLLVTYQAGSLLISAIMNWFNARVTSVEI